MADRSPPSVGHFRNREVAPGDSALHNLRFGNGLLIHVLLGVNAGHPEMGAILGGIELHRFLRLYQRGSSTGYEPVRHC